MLSLFLALAVALPTVAPADVPELVTEPTAVVESVDLATLDLLAPPLEAAANGKGCPRHIERCSAGEVGQPCHPDNLNVLCSAQANGAYCCLAYAP